jgi:hypothetical protein
VGWRWTGLGRRKLVVRVSRFFFALFVLSLSLPLLLSFSFILADQLLTHFFFPARSRDGRRYTALVRGPISFAVLIRVSLQMYSFDPYASLTEDQHSLVLGGESLLWTEQSDPNNLDAIVWCVPSRGDCLRFAPARFNSLLCSATRPRAAAAAEIFWTGPTLPDGTARNGREALPRLHDWRYVPARVLKFRFCKTESFSSSSFTGTVLLRVELRQSLFSPNSKLDSRRCVMATGD